MNNNEAFTALVNQMLEWLTPKELADYLGVSSFTILRWSNGKNLPYILARRAPEQMMLRHPIWNETIIGETEE